MNPISQLEDDIKSLRVQGATNVALKVLEGLNIAQDVLKEQKNPEPHIFLLEHVIRLAFTRPTEALAQNAVRFIFQKKQFPQDYLKLADQYKKMISETQDKVVKSGANLIETGSVYLTHCHSSSVTGIFLEAAKQGKKFKILVTETRPLFQGRRTANELLNAGLTNITMIVDSVAPVLLLANSLNITAILVGSDLLSEKGFVNKIGTAGIAFISHQKNIPLHCCGTLLKYDPRPYSDDLIETRSGTEIWPDFPENLKFLSPAFDFTPYYENISIVTEAGILKGNQIKGKALSHYPFLTSNLL